MRQGLEARPFFLFFLPSFLFFFSLHLKPPLLTPLTKTPQGLRTILLGSYNVLPRNVGVLFAYLGFVLARIF